MMGRFYRTHGQPIQIVALAVALLAMGAQSGCQGKRIAKLEASTDARILEISQATEQRLRDAAEERVRVERDLAMAQLHLSRASEEERNEINARVDQLSSRLESVKQLEKDLGQVKGRIDSLEQLEQGRANAIRRLIAEWGRIDEDSRNRYQ